MDIDDIRTNFDTYEWMVVAGRKSVANWLAEELVKQIPALLAEISRLHVALKENEAQSGCYRCQLGDPHTVHRTSQEVFGSGDERRIDKTTGESGTRSDRPDPITAAIDAVRDAGYEVGRKEAHQIRLAVRAALQFAPDPSPLEIKVGCDYRLLPDAHNSDGLSTIAWKRATRVRVLAGLDENGDILVRPLDGLGGRYEYYLVNPAYLAPLDDEENEE